MNKNIAAIIIEHSQLNFIQKMFAKSKIFVKKVDIPLEGNYQSSKSYKEIREIVQHHKNQGLEKGEVISLLQEQLDEYNMEVKALPKLVYEMW